MKQKKVKFARNTGLDLASEFILPEISFILNISTAFSKSAPERSERIYPFSFVDPCFYGKHGYPGLIAGDAEFVDVMHTDCGAMGIRRSVGDADVFVNTRMPLQPGCLTVLCSHNRSWELYAESASIGRQNDFLGSSKIGGPDIPVGFAMPTTAKGDYKLKTRAKSPFGLNAPENR